MARAVRAAPTAAVDWEADLGWEGVARAGKCWCQHRLWEGTVTVKEGEAAAQAAKTAAVAMERVCVETVVARAAEATATAGEVGAA